MNSTCRLASAVAASVFAVMVGSAAFGVAQNKDQQKCINKLDKDTCKVAATQGKENSACVKTGSKGPVAPNCLFADSKTKVAKKKTKTTDDETKNACLGANAPDFGYSSATMGNDAAVTEERDLFRDTYGTTDPSGVISSSKPIGGCQAKVTKDLEKLIAAKWKAFVKCKKDALKAGAISEAALEACMLAVPADLKVAGKLTKLNDDIQKKCENATGGAVPPGVAFNFGACGGETNATLAVCLDRRAECRFCLAVNLIDNLHVDCDLFDDGADNNSCNATITNHKCVLANVPAGASRMQLYTEALGVPINFNLIGSLDIGEGGPYATCSIQSLNPVLIIGIGFVCIAPSSNPCPPGRRFCGPGAGPAMGIDSFSDGDAGACTSNNQCAATCAGAAFCGSVANTLTAACTGFCTGTTPANQPCNLDATCLPSNGSCNGPDPVAPNNNICQCSCLDPNAHGPSDPGDMQCNLGSNIVVEMASPCNATDILINVGDTCIPISTQRASGSIVDANFNAGGGLVPVPPNVNDQTGAAPSCTTVDGSVVTGVVGVGAVNFFGSSLGDLSVALRSTCN